MCISYYSVFSFSQEKNSKNTVCARKSEWSCALFAGSSDLEYICLFCVLKVYKCVRSLVPCEEKKRGYYSSISAGLILILTKIVSRVHNKSYFPHAPPHWPPLLLPSLSSCLLHLFILFQVSARPLPRRHQGYHHTYTHTLTLLIPGHNVSPAKHQWTCPISNTICRHSFVHM